MKAFVNGEEVELEPTGYEVQRLSDRLVIKTPEGAFSAVAVRSGEAVLVSYRGRQYKIERSKPRSASLGAASGDLIAPMPGQIVDVLAKQGDEVKQGDRILVLEAMKTQQSFAAPFDGVVIKLNVTKGDQVVDGAPLATVKPLENTQ